MVSIAIHADNVYVLNANIMDYEKNRNIQGPCYSEVYSFIMFLGVFFIIIILKKNHQQQLQQ